MTFKERIRKWLGFEEVLGLTEAMVRVQAIQLEADFQRKLAQQRVDLTVEFASKLADHVTESEKRMGLVLDASMTAAEKISKVVAERGDVNLKLYIDACFESVSQASNYN